jgi:hypothetical protein
MKSLLDKLGYYQVGFKKFSNKTLALMETCKSGYKMEWIFNDDVYSSINWSTPIEESLLSIYKRRAEQLRANYDYLVLYFSGGADSINILHAFIDNNIFLDEIVMQLPEPARKQFADGDTSNGNLYAEIEYSAVPHLNKFKDILNPDTKIRYQDFAKPVLELLSHDDWFDTNPMGTNICISGIGRQVAQVTEKHILELCNKGKRIGQVLGVDKPLVYFDGTDYYAYFSDVSTMHAPPTGLNQSEVFQKYYHTEFFYWTPDMPEIVVKQAQEIKRYCDVDDFARMKMKLSLERHISEFKSILHPVIYPPQVTTGLQTEKPSSKIVRPMDQWFWASASEQIIGNYMTVINYLRDHTNPEHMIDGSIDNGISAHLSKFYKL